VTADELREEISIELELMEGVCSELFALRRDVAEREATVREKTAAAAFLAQFYGGVENILKRVCRFYAIELPSGATWHSELFRWFCAPSSRPLPVLFDDSLALALAPYRKFRHIVYHSYGFQVDWERMVEGIDNLEEVFDKFKARLTDYFETI